MNFLAFLITALNGLSFRLVGIVYVSELLLALVAVFFFYKPKYNKYIKTGLQLLLLWMAGGVIANLDNHASAINFAKGTFSRIFFMLDIIGFYIIFENKPKRLLFFLAGFCVAAILSFALPSFNMHAMDIQASGGDLDDDYYSVWGIYLAAPIIAGTASLLYYKGREKLAVLLSCLFAFISLFYLSRNIFVSWTLAALLLILIRKKIFETFNFSKKIILLFSVFLAIICIKTIYTYLVKNQYLGERAYNKYQMQSSEKMGLLSSRADFFMALKAVSEKPIVGYGDYALDYTNIRGRFSEKYMTEYSDAYSWRGIAMVPGHSHILGVWVYNGILALPFWLYLGYLIVIMVKKYMNCEPTLLCANLLLIIPFIWDYFFSPFGGRIMPALIFVYLCMCIGYYSKKDDCVLSEEKK